MFQMAQLGTVAKCPPAMAVPLCPPTLAGGTLLGTEWRWIKSFYRKTNNQGEKSRLGGSLARASE